jgi:hypothetical protein
MRREPVSVRGLVLLLSAGLVLAATGCQSGERRAFRSLNRIGEGMSKETVVELAGEADRTSTTASGEEWHYSYASTPDPQKIGQVVGMIFFAATVLGLLILLAAASASSGGSGALPETRGMPPLIHDVPDLGGGRVHFRVVFGRDGRVVLVSGLEACEEN